MFHRSIIILLLVVCLGIAANSWSRPGSGYYYGGASHLTESREIGWPCPIWGFYVEYWIDSGTPSLSQPTKVHWKVLPTRNVIWYGRFFIGDGVHIVGIVLTLSWWAALGWFLNGIACQQRWQFGLKQLLFLPVIVSSAFLLSSLF